MNTSPRFTLLLLILLLAPDFTNAQQAAGENPFNIRTLGRQVLSQEQVTRGLKEALGKGVQHAIARLGADGVFLTNLDVKITVPEKLAPIETTLRRLNQGHLVDEWITNVNHAAELAVKEVAPIFTAAITNMTVADAEAILNGPEDAATSYFRKTSEERIKERMLPIIQAATEKAGATGAYKQMLNRGQGGLGFLKRFRSNPLDLDAYVNDRATDGLFKVIAEKEKEIRQNPAGQASDLLKSVFGRVLNSNSIGIPNR